MNPAIEAALDTLLPEPDRQAYLAACRRTPAVVSRLVNDLEARDLVAVQVHTERVHPSMTIRVDVQRWIDGAFAVDYSTTIRISRLASIYAVEHGFEVQNRHPEATDPTLSGSDGFGFIAAQQALHAQVSTVLDEAGMIEVDAWTLGEPVVRLLGTRWHTATCTPTVGRALFEDLFELLDP